MSRLEGLGELFFFFKSRAASIGVSGSSIVDVTIRGARRVVFFVVSNCHFIFILFVAGNIVSAVVYVRRV